MALHRASYLCIGCLLLLRVCSPAQEALMPMRGTEFADFWPGGEQGAGARTITSKNAGGAADTTRPPLKTQISLKLPSQQAPRGEARTRLVVIENIGRDGVIDFSSAKQVRVQDNSAIPGLVEPEYLALEQCRIALPEAAVADNLTLAMEPEPVVISSSHELEPVMLPPPLEPLTGRRQFDLAAASFRSGGAEHPSPGAMGAEEPEPVEEPQTGKKNQVYDPRLTLQSLRPPADDASPADDGGEPVWRETTAGVPSGAPVAPSMQSIPGMGAVLRQPRQPEEDLVSPLGGSARDGAWREAKDGIIPLRRLGPW